jgi:hypothetical protein
VVNTPKESEQHSINNANSNSNSNSIHVKAPSVLPSLVHPQQTQPTNAHVHTPTQTPRQQLQTPRQSAATYYTQSLTLTDLDVVDCLLYGGFTESQSFLNSWKCSQWTVKIFVSSTFTDMLAEKYVLFQVSVDMSA